MQFFPDQYKTQEMRDDVRWGDSFSLQFVPDWFVTREWVYMWYDDIDENNFLKWYEGYKKRKAQKASKKEELLPIAWHPSRWWDWCSPEDEKKETEKLFLTI